MALDSACSVNIHIHAFTTETCTENVMADPQLSEEKQQIEFVLNSYQNGTRKDRKTYELMQSCENTMAKNQSLCY